MVYKCLIRFDPVKFEDIFRKHAHTNSDALTSDELMEMLKGNRDPKDYKNWWVYFNSFIHLGLIL